MRLNPIILVRPFVGGCAAHTHAGPLSGGFCVQRGAPAAVAAAAAGTQGPPTGSLIRAGK